MEGKVRDVQAICVQMPRLLNVITQLLPQSKLNTSLSVLFADHHFWCHAFRRW